MKNISAKYWGNNEGEKMSKIGLVALVTREYSGSYRSEEFVNDVFDNLVKKGISVIKAEKVVEDPSSALEVCDQFKNEEVKGLIIIDINWVVDSLQYIMINELKVPTMFWALPYNETYSLACVHHFGSFLKSQDVPFEYVYGASDDECSLNKVKTFANAVNMVSGLKSMRVGLIGPRQTWRVAGAQDITSEEFEFSDKIGPTILHIEMDELINDAENLTNVEVDKVKADLRDRSGKIEISDKAFDYMVRMYLATKKAIKKYHLDSIAAETCPNYSGLMNVQSSWLADEGFVVDTEGDIAHAVMQTCLNIVCKSATFLGEICSYKDDTVNIYHEGSTAHSLAKSTDDVRIMESGELGCYIGLSLRAMNNVTVFNLAGDNRSYKMFVNKAKVEECSYEEWENSGKGCLAKINFGISAKDVVDHLIKSGTDHHYVVKEGDYTNELRMLCNYLKIEYTSLDQKEG